MIPALLAVLASFRSLFRSRGALQAELFALRHQLLVLQRQRAGRRVPFRTSDRLLWAYLSRIWPGWRRALVLVQPETAPAGFPPLLALEEPTEPARPAADHRRSPRAHPQDASSESNLGSATDSRRAPQARDHGPKDGPSALMSGKRYCPVGLARASEIWHSSCVLAQRPGMVVMYGPLGPRRGRRLGGKALIPSAPDAYSEQMANWKHRTLQRIWGSRTWNMWRERKTREIDLSGASLSFANLIGWDLSGANLSNAWLTRADLNGANLSGANLRTPTWGRHCLQMLTYPEPSGSSPANIRGRALSTIEHIESPASSRQLSCGAAAYKTGRSS